MSEISRHRTIAGQRSITEIEIDRALQERFGLPVTARTVDVFGYGVAHAFDEPSLADYRTLAHEMPGLAAHQADISDAIETEMICGPPDDLPVADIDQPNRQPAQLHAAAENELREAFSLSNSVRDEQARLIAAQEFASLLPVLDSAVRRAGIQMEDLLDLGADGLTDFMHAMPWRGAVLTLRERRHRERHQAWKEGDLNDLSYLSLGLAYCDILVAEKQWAARIRAAGLDTRCQTIVISDLRELPAHLATG
jgi:hypothetical protein